MEFPSLTQGRTLPRTVINSKPAREAYGTMKTAYENLTAETQAHQANLAAVKASKPEPIHPVVAAASSTMSFEELGQHNPSAAYYRANGKIPKPNELSDFQKTITPVETPGLNEKDLESLKELANL